MTFLYLNSDQMGHGDPDLGKKLLTSFLKELVDSEIHIDVVGCVNSGINLTTNGSDVIELLQKLKAKGTRIATCGTCLDHYKKREELQTGEIGSMDQTVQIMMMADKIVRPC